MAFTTQSSRRAAMSDINVTPLVDVMLVLLIIFMVTAPMMQAGMTIDVPKADTEPLDQAPVSEDIVISISGPGNIYLNDVPVSEHELVSRIQETSKGRIPKAAFLRGDKNVPYAAVVRIMAQLRKAGIMNLNLITTPDEATTRK